MRTLVLLALTAAIASAASIRWTGIANDNQWTNHINWYPDQVPGQNDDVSIPEGIVQVTIATAVNSLSMGTHVNNPANLTLFQAFVIGNGGMQVSGNGNLIINTGLAQVYGTVTIAGTLQFIDGVLGGVWTVNSRGYANLGNANEKGFSGCAFLSEGQLSLGGVIVLNQSSTFTIKSTTQSNTNLILQTVDGSTTLFDASAAHFTYSTGVFTIQCPVQLGAFTLQSGNMTILDSLTFQQSLNIPAGSYVVALGNANLNVSNGATGAGVLTLSSQMATVGGLSMTGALNMLGGAAIVASASSVGILTLKGGNAVFNAATTATQLNLLTGTTAGTATVSATNVYLKTAGFTLGSAVEVTGAATLEASTLTFGVEGAFTVKSGAKATVVGALLLTGPAFIAGFKNDGTLTCNAAVSSQNINIMGIGTVVVSSTLNVNTATFNQATVTLASGASFAGEHSFLNVAAVASATGGNVNAVIGAYQLTCKAECDNVKTPGATTPTSAFSFTA